MPMTVNLSTESDQDFSYRFIYVQQVAAWLSMQLYNTNDLAAWLGLVWKALASNTNIAPDSDPTKWQQASAPPIDLTGSSLMMMARSPVDSNYAPISLTSDAGGGIVIDADPTTGAFDLTIPYATLAKVAPGQYAHSLIRLRPDGLRELVWNGTLTHAIGPTR